MVCFTSEEIDFLRQDTESLLARFRRRHVFNQKCLVGGWAGQHLSTTVAVTPGKANLRVVTFTIINGDDDKKSSKDSSITSLQRRLMCERAG
jgi:hypothetical protein